MKHSKTPWKLYSGKLVPEYPNEIVEVQDENGKAICKWTGFDGADQSPTIRKANAVFIVDACNCHDELLAACKMMRQAMTDYQMDVDDPPPQKHIDMMKKADAVIAKVGRD